MQFILTCPNGKQIDMSGFILKQLKGEMTHGEVQQKINYFKEINKIVEGYEK